MFQQLAGILQQQLGHQYPDIRIGGDNYNPGGGRYGFVLTVCIAKLRSRRLVKPNWFSLNLDL